MAEPGEIAPEQSHSASRRSAADPQHRADSSRGSGSLGHGAIAPHSASTQVTRRDTSPKRPRLSTSESQASCLSLGNQTFLQVLNAVGDYEAHHLPEQTRHRIRRVEASGDAGGRGPPQSYPVEQSDASDEDDEDDEEAMASSIHAIHRPIDFQRRRSSTSSAASRQEAAETYATSYSSAGTDGSPEPAGTKSKDRAVVDASTSNKTKRARATSRHAPLERKAQRRAKLAVMLRDIFTLEETEDVVAEYSCWLFRSVLLQGYLYLTSGHLCFYAYVKNNEGKTLRSGSLAKKSSLTGRFARHWFVLRDDTLTWYPSSTEPYFPDGDVSLQYCTSVDPSRKHTKQFKLATAERLVRFQCDSETSRDEWVRVLRKAVFQCQNEGESIKIAVPLETVVSAERSSLDFVEVLRIRVLDQEAGFAAEEYPFCYFSDLDMAFAQITDQLGNFRAQNPDRLLAQHSIDAESAREPINEAAHPPMITSEAIMSRTNALPPPKNLRDARNASEGPSVQTLAPPHTLTDEADSTPEAMSSSNVTALLNEPSSPLVETMSESVTYPPQATGPTPSSLQHKSWSTWVRSGAPLSRITSRIPSLSSRRRITEVVGAPHRCAPEPGQMLAADNPDPMSEIEEEEPKGIEERFRLHFSMPDREELLAVFPAYLLRLLPVHGKLYVSFNYICWRATGLVSRAKMVLPVRDLIVAERHRGWRLGYHGLVLVIKGYEEIFFEFGSKERCNQVRRLTSDLIEATQRDESASTREGHARLSKEAEQLRALEPSISGIEPLPTLQGSLEEAPPYMFRSDSSSFLNFRPPEPLHFTCLTIGSRGDVQPYIALCKGLIKDGHKCRIASHAEYKEWVEGHGIEFGSVDGDPAELMRICVDNGMFTVSFLREGVSKFRGWLEDLLKTAWSACQGTDVLIESPSAMAGIHIAEALQIPYYRAFTMPWTKTRIYPHAFAVPEHKLGGSYNAMSYAMFDAVFWKAISGQINRWRKTTLGLHSTSQDKMEAWKTPFLYNFSNAIVPPPVDWPEWIHITGYWFLDQPDDSATKKWSPPDSLLAFLRKAKDEGKKVVYIGFGSIVVSDPEALTRMVSDAVQESDVFAVVSKGWSDRLASKDDSAQVKLARAAQEKKERQMMSDRIYTVDTIPHDWLFDRIDAACHHGGAGTTGASLRAGIPTIIRPFFGDQYFWASRMEALGIGTSLRKMTVTTLADALKVATTDEKQIARARMVGQRIRKEDGVANAIETLYRELDYAKTLVKRHSRRDPLRGERRLEMAIASRQLPLAPVLSPSARSSRPPSGSWPSSGGNGAETSDEGSSWDHISRGSRTGDTDDDVLSRSGIGSSPVISPCLSTEGHSRRTSEFSAGDDTDDISETDGIEPGRSRPRRSSEGTARSPTRPQSRLSPFRATRLSQALH